MSNKLTRRKLMAVGLVVATSGGVISPGVHALTADALDMRKLQAATYKLLGQVPANPFFAQKIFGYMSENYSVATLNAFSEIILAAVESELSKILADNELTNMASDIANAWYSGTLSSGADKERVVGYVDNLSWQAIRFSTPQSVCGGHFGHWHKLPTGQ